MPISCDYAQLIQEIIFSEKIDFLYKKYSRIFDVHAAIDFTLGKNPLQGTSCTAEPEHYVYQTTEIGNTPSFWVLYRYDQAERTIYLISIIPAVEQEE